MALADNIKKLRIEKGYLQKQVAAQIGLGISHYNKIENGQREASISMMDRLAQLYNITIDQIVHLEQDMPTQVVLEDKTTVEQMQLIQKLNEKDKQTVFSIIEAMLTKQKFQEFFEQNLAS